MPIMVIIGSMTSIILSGVASFSFRSTTQEVTSNITIHSKRNTPI